ncbi:MAG TPA: hypothetical protein VIM99_00765 [Blastocatellia bacterium]
MERNALMEESIARAFQLAYFIHGDRETALNIAAEAFAKLEVAAAALIFAAIMIITLGLVFYRRAHDRAPQENMAEKKPARTTESPAPPAPAPAPAPTRRDRKGRPAPAPRTLPDDSETLLAKRGGALAPDGASLSAVKKVHVDPFGDDPIGMQFRDQLISALRANRRFALIANRDEADAVLKGKITATRHEQASATVRLVNAKGDVLWPVKGPSAGKQYQGPISVITGQIARDLLADMDKAGRK